MVLFDMYGVFFRRFLESRNYKIQVIAHVGRKSAALLSGLMEASYSHFFIGRGFNRSRGRFHCKVGKLQRLSLTSLSRHLESRRIELSSKSSALLMWRFRLRGPVSRESTLYLLRSKGREWVSRIPREDLEEAP